jgi:hypothetical protein
MEQLQSHIWLTASSYLGKYFRISSYIRKPSSYMTLQLLHSEFPYIWGKFDLLFYQCILNACFSLLAKLTFGDDNIFISFHFHFSGLTATLSHRKYINDLPCSPFRTRNIYLPRVPQCLSPRPNDSPTPSPASQVHSRIHTFFYCIASSASITLTAFFSLLVGFLSF